MSAVAKVSSSEPSNAHLTNISVNARIDYILRFNKQAIIVVGETAADYAPVTSQYLSALTPDFNAAYISVSQNLHDIQIRSRLIEQLFANVLFDPEQSLALTVVNLVKANPQQLAIAIEHGQNLSTQILHELTQLAEISAKSQLAVDVVISGDYSLGQKLSENSILFKKKVALISADSGQLLQLHAAIFKPNSAWRGLLSKKAVLFLGLFVLITAISAALLYWLVMQSPTKTLNQIKPIDKTFVSIAAVPSMSIDKARLATSEDVLNAITFANNVEKKPVLATSEDIINALAIDSPVVAVQKDKVVATQTELTTLKSAETAKAGLDWYLMPEQGYVIQFAAFSDDSVRNDFITQFPALDYIQYTRLIDTTAFKVLTSKPYSTRAQAENALNSMPTALKSLNIWIKRLDIIKNEIKHFQSSQS